MPSSASEVPRGSQADISHEVALTDVVIEKPGSSPLHGIEHLIITKNAVAVPLASGSSADALKIEVVLEPPIDIAEAELDEALRGFMARYVAETTVSPEVNDAQAAQLVQMHLAAEKQKSNPVPKARDWSEALGLAIKAYKISGVKQEDFEQGNFAAGTVYPYATAISLACMGWMPSYFAAYPTKNVDPFANAMAVLAGQILVMLTAPWINALSHLAVSPAQDQLYRGKCTVLPETAGARPLDVIDQEARKRQAECDRLSRKLNEQQDSGDTEAAQATTQELEAALGELEQTVQDYGKSLEANKINFAGQTWNNRVRALRSMFNSAAALYGPLARDPVGSFWIQFAGVVVSALVNVPAARWDQDNKQRQQLVTMLANKDFRKSDCASVQNEALEPEHMDTKAFRETMEGPCTIRVKHEKQHLKTKLRYIEQDIAQLQGLTAMQMGRRDALFAEAGFDPTTDHEAAQVLLQSLDKARAALARGGEPAQSVHAEDLRMLEVLLGRTEKEKKQIDADELARLEVLLGALLKSLSKPLDGHVELELKQLSTQKAAVQQDVDHLGKLEWDQMSPEHKRDLLDLMQSSTETGWIFPLNPFTSTSSAPYVGITATARQAVAIGMRKAQLPEEFIPNATQKIGGYWQMLVGGSATPTLVSATMRAVQAGLRRRYDDPSLTLSPAVRYPIAAAMSVVSVVGAFASPWLINEKNRVRESLREGANNGTLDLPIGWYGQLTSGAFWGQFFKALGPALVALPTGVRSDWRASRSAGGAEPTLNSTRALLTLRGVANEPKAKPLGATSENEKPAGKIIELKE